ncbi:MAG: heme exporter protein CcmD [Gammaproteobacteria bacterium]|jgi:heme exporter protein D|uniref:heme exporter protein CcmD n=1 Tax=Methyloprofundus sp. TaxID=2020875 RepID=UPI001830F1B9|nr:heme exporter protein CcmD [Methyloprofundus sp.]MBT3811745.1 heme exporter protein CcmD [Gammaproteobacteria bacterium]HIL78549.1 heme exporter protein CcmD [Methylococcales bacterium]MBT4145609.1 heme exporter protein CcmD [Gammaproteobacteria bacterium]MBT5222866.1 heme exporter protein CcmD [Gammaproteobacteria bacterium]MBT5824969.1 heme exporter protein CcmD [Gammaproteobacteria bacterium]
MGYFSSVTDFLQMGTHGLYVWLSYGIALVIFIYNIFSAYWLKRQYFINAKRRLRREQGTV